MQLTTTVLLFHLMGLTLGAGAAFLLDLVIMRFCVSRRISRGKYQIIKYATRVTVIGLGLLWYTGLMFLWLMAAHDPEALANPKIWAKLTIVGILTLNGLYIHSAVLPVIRRNIGSRIFDGVSKSQKRMMLASGAISTVSWITPMVLGALRDLDLGKPFVEGYLTFMGIYLVAVVCAIMGSFTYHWWTRYSRRLRARKRVRIKYTVSL